MLTDKAVQNLKPKAERYDVREANTPLLVRVSPDGVKRLYYFGRIQGVPTRRLIGRYAAPTSHPDGETSFSIKQAHAKCDEWKDHVAGGQDPQTVEARRRKHSVAEVIEEFIRLKVKHERSADKAARDLRNIAEWL